MDAVFLFKGAAMATNITASGATSIGQAKAIRLVVNTGLTGTIVVTTAGSSQYGTTSSTIATITNPAVGQAFIYGGLQTQGSVSINPSGACDITVSKINGLN